MRTSSLVTELARTGALAEFEQECVLITRDGEERCIGGTLSPIRDHDARVTGAVIVFGGAKLGPDADLSLGRSGDVCVLPSGGGGISLDKTSYSSARAELNPMIAATPSVVSATA